MEKRSILLIVLILLILPILAHFGELYIKTSTSDSNNPKLTVANFQSELQDSEIVILTASKSKIELQSKNATYVIKTSLITPEEELDNPLKVISKLECMGYKMESVNVIRVYDYLNEYHYLFRKIY